MNRGWSLLFLALPVVVIGSFILAATGVAPFDRLWLAPNANQSEPGIDRLVNLLHAVVGVVLALTGLFLAVAIWRGTAGGSRPAAAWAQHAWLEIIWTAIPAAILVWLSLSQFSAWNSSRRDQPLAADGSGQLRRPLVRVVAQRFHWEFHHAGADRITGTADDVVRMNELVVPGGEDVVLELLTRDVVHSFGVPALRLKQDIVPGLMPLVWFRMNPGDSAEIVCTELCGWGHYLMQARISAVPADQYAREFGSANVTAAQALTPLTTMTSLTSLRSTSSVGSFWSLCPEASGD